MPERFDIFKGFKAGSEVARKAYEPYDEEQKAQRDFGRQKQLLSYKQGLETEAATTERNAFLRSIPGGMKLKQYAQGGATYYNPEYTDEMNEQRVQAAIDKKSAMGAGAESGKMALAKESIRNISDIKKLLFPG